MSLEAVQTSLAEDQVWLEMDKLPELGGIDHAFVVLLACLLACLVACLLGWLVGWLFVCLFVFSCWG